MPGLGPVERAQGGKERDLFGGHVDCPRATAACPDTLPGVPSRANALAEGAAAEAITGSTAGDNIGYPGRFTPPLGTLPRAQNLLVAGRQNCHVGRVMKRWSSQQVLALFFGLLLAVGTVVSAVQASDMALDLATSGCTDSAGAICGGDDGDGDVFTSACLPICGGGACGVIPSRTTLNTADRPRMLTPIHPASLGRASSPDPDPPRTIDLV